MAERELTLLIESSNTTQNAIKGANKLTAEPKDSKAARYSYEVPFCYPLLHTHTHSPLVLVQLDIQLFKEPESNP